MTEALWWVNGGFCAVLAFLSMVVWENGDGPTWIVGVLVCALALRREAESS